MVNGRAGATAESPRYKTNACKSCHCRLFGEKAESFGNLPLTLPVRRRSAFGMLHLRRSQLHTHDMTDKTPRHLCLFPSCQKYTGVPPPAEVQAPVTAKPPRASWRNCGCVIVAPGYQPAHCSLPPPATMAASLKRSVYRNLARFVVRFLEMTPLAAHVHPLSCCVLSRGLRLRNLRLLFGLRPGLGAGGCPVGWVNQPD
jgi:hypothetical protein